MGTLGAWVGMAGFPSEVSRRGSAGACGLEVGACCPGLVALPERIEGQGATWRHLGPWVGRPQQPSHGRAESGHMGAAEGKNAEVDATGDPGHQGGPGRCPSRLVVTASAKARAGPPGVGDASNRQSRKLYRLPTVPKAGTDLPTSSALPLAEGPGQRGLAGRGRGSRCPCRGALGCCVVGCV